MAIVFTSEPVAKNTTTKNLDLIKAAECKLQEKSVEYTQNAEFEVLPDEGYDGMSKVNVSVDAETNERYLKEQEESYKNK